jgi:hypothetical protein
MPALSAERPSNIFAAQSRPRREEDLMALNFDLGPEEEMEYNEHIRFRELMEYRLQEQKQKEREQMLDRMERRERSRSRDREGARESLFKSREDLVLEEKPSTIEEEISAEIKS